MTAATTETTAGDSAASSTHYRIGFTLNVLHPLTIPIDSTIAEATARVRDAFLAADLVDKGHNVSLIIDGDDDALTVTTGQAAIYADGHMLDRATITRVEPEQPTAAIPTDHAELVAYLRGVPLRDRERLVDVLAAQYRQQGHPSPLAMAADALERATAEIGDAPRDLIPTDLSGLYDFVRKLPDGARHEVADLLAVQLGGTPRAIEQATDLVDEVIGMIFRDNLIDRLRAQLAEHLADATTAIKNAQNTIDRLAAPDVYDEEYAEGQARDLYAFLDDAGRMMRAATALNPCPPATTGTDQ